MSRYKVVEVEGYPTVASFKPPGISVHVLDTLVGHRIVASFRSEDYRGRRLRNQAEARFRDAALCAELNGEEPPVIAPDSPFQPQCRCGRSYKPDQFFCACGRKYDEDAYRTGAMPMRERLARKKERDAA